MAHTSTLVLTLFVYCVYSLALAVQTQHLPQQQIIVGGSEIKIRPATELDLDDIVTVLVDAFSPGPLYRYLFPQFDKFKERYWQCTREELGRQFANIPANVFVNVIAVPVGGRTEAGMMPRNRHERVVDVAIWNILEPDEDTLQSHRASPLESYLRGSSCEKHIGANLTRAAHYSKQFSAAEERYVDNYPGTQVYLNILATHPNWDGQGFGAAQCHWGMAMASEMGRPTTLLATPAGWPLYDSLGFESVANITIKTLDSFDDLWFEYMRYNYSSTIAQMG